MNKVIPMKLGALIAMILTFSQGAAASELLGEINYQSEVLQIVGSVQPAYDGNGIEIKDPAIYYQGSKYYLSDRYPYASEMQKLVCKTLGFSRSRPQYRGAWFYQYGISITESGIEVENLSNVSYAASLYCANSKIQD